MNILLRTANQSDIDKIGELFYDTIQNVNKKDYTIDQIDDWSSSYNETNRWEGRIDNQYFVVAIYNNILVGFSSIDLDGYLDFMFVHKDFQNKGIGTKLLQEIEKKALKQHNQSITSEVSITARSFFEYQGYKVIKKQIKRCRKENMINFKMIKHLD